jgi:hypothetical protein
MLSGLGASKIAYMAQLHMCSTSLILSSSLRVKGLTHKCYIWNDKAYKLALALLNFQVVLNFLTTTPHVPHAAHPTSKTS